MNKNSNRRQGDAESIVLSAFIEESCVWAHHLIAQIAHLPSVRVACREGNDDKTELLSNAACPGYYASSTRS